MIDIVIVRRNSAAVYMAELVGRPGTILYCSSLGPRRQRWFANRLDEVLKGPKKQFGNKMQPSRNYQKTMIVIFVPNWLI